MAPRVLLVLPTRTYRAEAFLAAARRSAIDVVVASDEASTLARWSGAEVVVDLGSPERAADRAAEAAATHPFDGVVGVDETAVLTAAHIAERLGVRHHPVDAVATTRDKRRLREVLATARLQQPRFAVTDTAATETALDAAAVAAGGYPVVVKPVDLAASRGVIRADDRRGLRSAVDRVARICARIACESPTTAGGGTGSRSSGDGDPTGPAAGPWPLLVEQFLDGPEVAVEGMVRDGHVDILAIFDKPEPLDGPVFAETIYTTPSRHRPATRAALSGLTVAAARAIGLRDGPLHAELRLPLTGPAVLEVAARSIGGLCSRVLRLGPTGSWSLEELILRHAVGDPLGDLPITAQPAGVLMLPVPRAGRLRAVEGVAEASAVPGVEGVTVSVAAGTEVEPLPEGDRYLGFVFARHDTPLEVELALRRARDLLRVVID